MKKMFFFTALILSSSSLFAAGNGDLVGAINSVNTSMAKVPDAIKTFLNIIAVIIGGYGIIRVYSKHQNGDQDTNKAMGQFAFAFVFVIAARLLVDSIFGI